MVFVKAITLTDVLEIAYRNFLNLDIHTLMQIMYKVLSNMNEFVSILPLPLPNWNSVVIVDQAMKRELFLHTLFDIYSHITGTPLNVHLNFLNSYPSSCGYKQKHL